MQTFLARHQPHLQGTLTGFDRLRFSGQLLLLSFARGLARFLKASGVLLRDFGHYAAELSERIKQATTQLAETTPTARVHYLASSAQRKEDFVRQLPPLERPTGLVAILSCVEPCRSYVLHRNRATKHLELVAAPRKCLHYYFSTIRKRARTPAFLDTAAPGRPGEWGGSSWIAPSS